MSKMMEDIRCLSQEIGFRPAGTEDEQNASFYIQDRLEKSTSFKVENEEFDCSANAHFSYMVYSCTAVFVCILSIFINTMVVPAIVIAVCMAIFIVLELFGGFALINRFIKRNLSQNVVAIYDPKKNDNVKNPRNRKVVIVSNIDTTKNQIELSACFIKVLPFLQTASIVCVFLLPLLMFVNEIFFQSAQWFIFMYIVCMIVMVLPVIFNILQRSSSFSPGANCNASGVAVMLNLAEKIDSIAKQAPEEQKLDTEKQEIIQENKNNESSSFREMRKSISDNDMSRRDLSSAKKALATFGESKKHKKSSLQENLVSIDGYAVPDANNISQPKYTTEDKNFAQTAQNKKHVARGVDALFGGSSLSETVPEKPESNTVPATRYQKNSGLVPDWYVQAQAKAKANDEPDKQNKLVNVKKSKYAEAYDAYTVDQIERDKALQLKQIKERKLSYVADMEKLNQKPKPNKTTKEIPLKTNEQDKTVDLIVSESRFSEVESAKATDWSKNDNEKAKSVDEQHNADSKLSEPKDNKPFEQDEKLTCEPIAKDYGCNIDAFAMTADISTDDNDIVDVKTVETQTKKLLSSDEKTQRAPLDISVTDTQSASKEMLSTLLPTIDVNNSTNLELSEAIRETKVTEAKNHENLESALSAISSNNDQNEKMILSNEDNLQTFESDSINQNNMFEEKVSEDKKSIDDVYNGKSQDLADESRTEITSDNADESANLNENNKSHIKSVVAEAIVAEGHGKPGMTGSFASVGSKIVKEHESNKLEDLVVEDTDDHEFQEGFTDSGAYIGSNYLEMPKSRIKKYFQRFKKKTGIEEKSMTEALQISEDFNATDVGKKRGNWESFKEEATDNRVQLKMSTKKGLVKHKDLENVDDSSFEVNNLVDSSDEFEGGAFSKSSLNKVKDNTNTKFNSSVQVENNSTANDQKVHLAVDNFKQSSTGKINKVHISTKKQIDNMNKDAASFSDCDPDNVCKKQSEEDIIKKFRSTTIDKEVWFVALGAETRNAEGMKYFLEKHKKELRGAVYIQLESLGAGNLSYVVKDGYINTTKISNRLRFFVEKTARHVGLQIKKVNLNYKESASSFIQKKRFQSMRLVGEINSKPAYLGKTNDTIDNVSSDLLEERSAFVLELLRDI